MDTSGLIEFRYADGRIVKDDLAKFAPHGVTRGAELDYDGDRWLMYDREDRGGVTVHLFTPAGSAGAANMSRARMRKRGSS
jgi:hypothetical protein